MGKYGHKSRLYNCWCHIKSRCYNPNNKDYKYYGDRNIKVCEEWRNSYAMFRDWALNNGYTEELEIDRIDSNNDYTPENCRWATRKQQMNNIRTNHIIKYQGVEKTLSEWSEFLKIPYSCLKQRINKQHWSIERAFTTPLLRSHQTTFGEGVSLIGKTFYLEYDKKIQSAKQWANELGVHVTSLDRRINKGWDAKRCLTQPFKNN